MSSLVSSVPMQLYCTPLQCWSAGKLAATAENADVRAVVQYEPELFPGLIYRMKEPKVVLLIFVSGKVVLTGAQPSRPELLFSACG